MQEGHLSALLQTQVGFQEQIFKNNFLFAIVPEDK
jgi:hypothetical protein